MLGDDKLRKQFEKQFTAFKVNAFFNILWPSFWHFILPQLQSTLEENSMAQYLL